MIIIKYLVKETFKAQLSILFVLVLIFLCQKLVRILGFTVDGEIPTNLVFTLLWLGIPEMAQLVLPLSLFLAILMTFGRLYTENEISVMHACGAAQTTLIQVALILALITTLFATINVVWLTPWSARSQGELTQKAKSNPGAAALVAGQFQQSQDGNHVLFIENAKGSHFNHVFLAQLRPRGSSRPSVVSADSGNITLRSDGAQVVKLNKGTRFEGTALLRDFRITDFKHYQAVIGYEKTDFKVEEAEQLDFLNLIKYPSAKFRSDLNWRLTLIFSSFLMALMVVPLSKVNPRQGRMLSMFPAMLLYLIFFLAQSLLRSNGADGRLNSTLWVWMLNIGYLSLAIFLNLWDSVPIRRARQRFLRKEAH